MLFAKNPLLRLCSPPAPGSKKSTQDKNRPRIKKTKNRRVPPAGGLWIQTCANCEKRQAENNGKTHTQYNKCAHHSVNSKKQTTRAKNGGGGSDAHQPQDLRGFGFFWLFWMLPMFFLTIMDAENICEIKKMQSRKSQIILDVPDVLWPCARFRACTLSSKLQFSKNAFSPYITEESVSYTHLTLPTNREV